MNAKWETEYIIYDFVRIVNTVFTRRGFRDAPVPNPRMGLSGAEAGNPAFSKNFFAPDTREDLKAPGRELRV